MTEVDAALHSKITSIIPLMALIAPQYRGQHKVFTQTHLPEGVTGNYIVIPPSTGTGPNDTKTSVGLKHVRQIECYTPYNINPAVVDEMAGYVWGNLHRQPLSVAGWRNIIIDAAGPIVAPTDKTLHGRIVVVSMTLWHWNY